MKISVIIPVYNAEKYLGVCLESILIQTFQDFEVIVIDDCSTDASLAVAESYLERFDGRLKIICLEKNTGSGAVPRNVGLENSCGEYVFFMDADDLITDEAFETLYACAEEYSTEIIYMEKFFSCDADLIPSEINISVWCNADSLVEEPTLDNDDFKGRVRKFLSSKFCWSPWAKFLRRDFLINNDIKFPRMTIAEDVIHTFEMICLAKKILRLPMPLYICRENNTSMMRRERTPEQMIKFRTSPLIIGLECLEEFMHRIEFFNQNPVIRLQVLNFFALMQIDSMKNALNALEPQEVYEIFLREFSKAGSSQPALISYLLVMNNIYRNELNK